MIFQRNFFKKAKSYYVVDLENALYADCDFIDSGSNYAVCVSIYTYLHTLEELRNGMLPSRT